MTWVLLAIFYVAFIAIFFAVKLNRGKTVESSRPESDHITAIDFYWRPG